MKCSTCKRSLSISGFHKGAKVCKRCKAEYYKATRPARLAYQMRYYTAQITNNPVEWRTKEAKRQRDRYKALTVAQRRKILDRVARRRLEVKAFLGNGGFSVNT